MTTYAYARVSRTDLSLDNQRKAFTECDFQVDEVFSEDGVSGSVHAMARPMFSAMVGKMVRGDTIIVTMVDRLGRSVADILKVVEMFQSMGIKVRILQFDSIDITSSTGKMVLTIMAAMAELERNILIERTNAGLARAKSQGTLFGRALTIPPEKLEAMMAGKRNGLTLDVLSAEHGYPRNTIARNISKWKGDMCGYTAEWAGRRAQHGSVERSA